MTRHRHDTDHDEHDSAMRFDMATVLLIATIILVILYVFWELWAGHPFPE